MIKYAQINALHHFFDLDKNRMKDYTTCLQYITSILIINQSQESSLNYHLSGHIQTLNVMRQQDFGIRCNKLLKLLINQKHNCHEAFVDQVEEIFKTLNQLNTKQLVNKIFSLENPNWKGQFVSYLEIVDLLSLILTQNSDLDRQKWIFTMNLDQILTNLIQDLITSEPNKGNDIEESIDAGIEQSTQEFVSLIIDENEDLSNKIKDKKDEIIAQSQKTQNLIDRHYEYELEEEARINGLEEVNRIKCDQITRLDQQILEQERGNDELIKDLDLEFQFYKELNQLNLRQNENDDDQFETEFLICLHEQLKENGMKEKICSLIEFIQHLGISNCLEFLQKQQQKDKK